MALNDKWLRRFTGHDPCVMLHYFHHIKWDLFNLNEVTGWQCQGNRVARQGRDGRWGQILALLSLIWLVKPMNRVHGWKVRGVKWKKKKSRKWCFCWGKSVSKRELGRRRVLITSETGMIGKDGLENGFAAWPCWGHCWSSWRVVHSEHERPGWERNSGVMRIRIKKR